MPPRFAQRFDFAALETHGATLVAIDPSGVILWFNRAWQRFACENDGLDVLDRFGVGVSYLDGIAGEPRALLGDMFAEALRTGRVAALEYECSSAEVQRWMRLRALPVTGAGLFLEHSCIMLSPRVGQAREAFEALYLSDLGIVVQCSNCRRVRQCKAGTWDWVADWAVRPHPNTSHGICEVCSGFYYGVRHGY